MNNPASTILYKLFLLESLYQNRKAVLTATGMNGLTHMLMMSNLANTK